jgi:site-specific DNA-adenine methylase
MKFIGSKNDPDLFKNLIKNQIPKNLLDFDYIEPFGGSFGLSKLLESKPKRLIYNDILKYDVKIDADIILNTDYKEVLDLYDGEKSLFYLDPPYYGKESYYKMKQYDKNFHSEIKKSVQNRKGKILISYQDCPFIRELYDGYSIHKYLGTHKYKLNEILISI